MTDDLLGERAKRIGALGVVAAIGLVFTMVFLGDLVVNDEQSLLRLVSGYSLLFSLSLIASSEWLRRQPFTGDDLWHIVGWLIGGTVPLAFVTWLVLLDRTAAGLWTTLGDIAHVAVVGAIGGVLIGVFIVRQRATTDRLRHTRGRLESVLDASPLPIVSVDTDSRITTWNPAAEHTFGWTEDEVVGEQIPSTTDAAGFDELRTRFQHEALVGGIEERRPTKSGGTIDVRTHFSPIYDGSEVAGGMAILQDITQENRREEELTRSRQLLSWTEEMADVGGWELDLRSDELRWTDGTRRIHEVGDGYEPELESAIGFYHPSHQDVVESLVEQALETGEPYGAELQITTARGRDRWVEISGERIDRSGSPAYLRGAIRDISDQKEQEQRLMVLNRVLRHNLRNDLNVIQGRAEMIYEDLRSLDGSPAFREPTDTPELVATLSGLESTSADLHSRISRFLTRIQLLEEFPVGRAKRDARTILRKSNDLASLGDKARQFDQFISDTTGVATELIAVRPLVERVTAQYQSPGSEASVTVRCDGDPHVLGEPRQLEVALDELVENAITHSGDSAPDVTVTVTVTEQSTERVEICVADRGPGLPRTEYETLHRGEETPLMHGQGLGLWLVKWSISQLGGSVSVTDNDPTGTRVTVTLPAAPEISAR